jgi:biotin carboxyl carrier protein
MNCEVETRGTRRSVEVHRVGQDWVVTLDGQTSTVNVRQVGDTWSMLIGEGPSRRSFDIRIDGRTNGERIVHVNGRSLPVLLVDPRERLTRRSLAGAHVGEGPRSIVAPMPGRIVKVLVKAGDRVAAHQGLVVVEAMKMENELRAPRAGSIADVRVKDGMSVEARAVLIVLE